MASIQTEREKAYVDSIVLSVKSGLCDRKMADPVIRQNHGDPDVLFAVQESPASVAVAATVVEDSDPFADSAEPVKTILGCALECASRGWHVHPCAERGKVAISEHGVNDATTDADVIRGWFANPRINYAVAGGDKSNLVIIDIDEATPEEETALNLPDTFRVQSGRVAKPGMVNGTHRYYRGSCATHSLFAAAVEPITQRETLNKRGEKVIQSYDVFDRLIGKKGVTIGEVRSRGAYVIGYGSIHTSGNPYTIVNDVSLADSPEINTEPVNTSTAASSESLRVIADYVEQAFTESGIDYTKPDDYNGGLIWLIDCPWDYEHSGGKSLKDGGSSSAVLMLPSGALSFVCKHAHCEQTRQWAIDPTGDMDSLRGWMESAVGHKLSFQEPAPEVFFGGMAAGTASVVSDDYLLFQVSDENSSLQERITNLREQGKSTEEIAELSGWNKLVAESLAKVAPDTIKASTEITDDVLDREFPSYDGEDAGPIPTLIENFLPKGANFFGSLSGVGKTWLGLSVAKALTSGEPLFGIFSVKEKVAVLYLIPEASNATFKNRMKLMRICRDKKLFRYRTISQGITLSLKDPLTVNMIQKLRDGGRRQVLVIADTAIRFLQAKDENASTDNSLVGDSDYLRSKDIGADLLFMHHSPKASKKEAELTLENVLRGTGDFGAMADAVYGIRRDETLFAYGEGPEELEVVCVKPRDLENPPLPFRVVLKRKPGKDDTKTRPISVIEETGDVGYLGPEAVKNKAGHLLDFTLGTEQYISLNKLTVLLKMRRELVKDLALARGWKQVPETVFGGDGNPLKASNGQDKKRFRWTQVTAGQVRKPVERTADPASDSDAQEEICLDSK